MQNLINVPAQSALAMLQPVFYSASAKMQGNQGHLRQGLRAMFAAVMLFVTPVFIAIAVVARTFILALYGAKWAGGETVLTPLALAVPAIFLMGLSTPVLWTAGYPRREFQVQLPMAVVWAAVCFAAARYGTLAIVCWAVLAVYVLRAAVIVGMTSAAVALPARELPGLLGPGLIVSAIVAVAAISADGVSGLFNAGPQLRLASIVVTCGIAMLAGLRLVHALLPGELKSLLVRVVDRVPRGNIRRAIGQVLGV
jgi:lipopolysaccharide exporter